MMMNNILENNQKKKIIKSQIYQFSKNKDNKLKKIVK